LCLLFHLFLPFLPLVIEAAILRNVEDKTLLLFLAIYPLSIGVSSRNRLMFGKAVVIGLAYSTFFGLNSGDVLLSPVIYNIGYLCLAAVMIIHMGERYNRHVVDRDLFWEFGSTGVQS